MAASLTNMPDKQLELAAKRGDLSEVKSLLERPQPTHNYVDALTEACRQGQTTIALALLPHVELRPSDPWPLRIATLHGQAAVFREMLPILAARAPIPQSYAFMLLREAASEGYVDLVKLILPMASVPLKNSSALQFAVQYGHRAVAELLFPLSDVTATLEYLHRYEHLTAMDLLLSMSSPAAIDLWLPRVRPGELPETENLVRSRARQDQLMTKPSARSPRCRS